MTAAATTKWRMKGVQVGSCNCAWGCPCQFGARPTSGQCDGLSAVEVTSGHFGDVSLDGVRWVWTLYWPGSVSEGNGTRQLIIDESATQEQREAIDAIVDARHGGAVFEIYASVTPNRLDTIYAPIEFVYDRPRRRASVRIANIVESTVEPITTVTGAEHVAKIVLPNGFEWKEADMANSVKWRAKMGDVRTIGGEGTYAELEDVDWSND